MHRSPAPIETLEQMLAAEEPNLLRLYLNPHVAQVCFCLDRYVRTTWAGAAEDYQSFLANSLEEALAGAIKLVRYNRDSGDSERVGLILDPRDRLAGFAHIDLLDGRRVEFLPGLLVLGPRELGHTDWLAQVGQPGVRIDPFVLIADDDLEAHSAAINQVIAHHRPAVITCVSRASFARLRSGPLGVLAEVAPDVVVCDESFAEGVPFGAFTALRSRFAAWNRPRKSTFHSTTFQPNTISTRHFMNTLAALDPAFVAEHAAELQGIVTDLDQRADAFGRYYQPTLARLIRTAGFATADVRAAGSVVTVAGRPILDFVGGVACSVRGHNPPGYTDEIRALADPGGPAPEVELAGRLRALTGLGFALPAVSGANAVENALRVALVARFPRRQILALRAGFGGKTLLALTGTANPSYKDRIGPLYDDVHYVDPFAPDANDRVDALLGQHEFAAVLVELIQSVGGVRRLPEDLVRHLDAGRERHGYLLIVDEIQTGLFRTGPFGQSATFGLVPDLLLLGKGTSDMMFPFSLTLTSDAVAESLAVLAPELPAAIRRRYGYELGYRTMVNTLRRADDTAIAAEVAAAGAEFARRLRAGLAGNSLVREIRIYGLLIAIELDAHAWPHRWLGKRLAALYLLAMLQHEHYPLMAGFCQYEPNTLKVTPPLNVRPDEIAQSCATIIDVLNRPLARVLLAALGRLLKPPPIRKDQNEHRPKPAPELARV